MTAFTGKSRLAMQLSVVLLQAREEYAPTSTYCSSGCSHGYSCTCGATSSLTLTLTLTLSNPAIPAARPAEANSDTEIYLVHD
jgi:hypothetical protein